MIFNFLRHRYHRADNSNPKQSKPINSQHEYQKGGIENSGHDIGLL